MFRKKEATYIPRSCCNCGCLLEKGRERTVRQEREHVDGSTSFGFIYSEHPRSPYYCGRCKPPYDTLVSGWAEGDRYYRDVPATRIRVNEDGSEYKEKK